jgi:succinylglutamic semialdehyde dehydrogenase
MDAGAEDDAMDGSSGDPLVSINPADPGDEIGRFEVADERAVAEAVERARAAFPAWRDAGFETRAKVIRRFGERVGERVEELAQRITREMGKAIWDARGEARLVPAKVGVSLGEGMQLVAPMEAGPGARATYHPRGVLAVLGPFNFPAHLPNGHIIPALATGNTVVFKPSELTPAVGAWMADVWREAGLPDGVLEVVQGRGETGAALAGHSGVDGVLFTGSSATGRALQEGVLDQPGKLLALEMGGKNAIVVLEDADLDLAVSETALSICATTGQRCSCASRLFVHTDVLDVFAERLAAVLRGVAIGPPQNEAVFMGPLASGAAATKVAHFREQASEAGGERILLVDPALPAPYVGAGLVYFRDATQTHPYQREEIFGPEAALYPIADLDEAIAAVNDSDYGLVASVMTRDRVRYEHAIGRIETGLLNWNKGTIGASGKLPFGGTKKSGNDRPAGVTASLYCTTPQAHLESDAGFDPDALPPGMPRP